MTLISTSGFAGMILPFSFINDLLKIILWNFWIYSTMPIHEKPRRRPRDPPISEKNAQRTMYAYNGPQWLSPWGFEMWSLALKKIHHFITSSGLKKIATSAMKLSKSYIVAFTTSKKLAKVSPRISEKLWIGKYACQNT